MTHEDEMIRRARADFERERERMNSEAHWHVAGIILLGIVVAIVNWWVWPE